MTDENSLSAVSTPISPLKPTPASNASAIGDLSSDMVDLKSTVSDLLKTVGDAKSFDIPAVIGDVSKDVADVKATVAELQSSVAAIAAWVQKVGGEPLSI